MEHFVMVLTIISFILFFVILLILRKNRPPKKRDHEEYIFESEQKIAGRNGERFATQVIQDNLRENDILLTNIKVSFEEREAELDNVVINNRGVFIIEVKNYRGELIGQEEEYEWEKIKYSHAGERYQTKVKNPIQQVKRQAGILHGYLEKYGIDIWVEGYAFFVEGNSPIRSARVLENPEDINTALHFRTNRNLRNSTKEQIIRLLS